MIPSFTYEQRTRIEFGQGCLQKTTDILKELGAKKVLIVTDSNIKNLPFFAQLQAFVEKAGAESLVFDQVEPNPSVQTADAAAAVSRDGCDAVIGLGGGSVMDVAKSAAILAANPGSIAQYLFGAGDAQKQITVDGIPVLAIPTTAGTGSEVSNVVVITDGRGIKDLALHNFLFPRFALVDPEITLKLPPYITAATGLDVLGHALEGFTSTINCEISELMALEAIRLCFRYLPKCVKSPDIESRGYMAYACTLAGIAQSLGACTAAHALSCPLTIRYGIPHGHAVGIAQIPVIEFTKTVIPEKYKRIVDYIDPAADVPCEQAAGYLIGKIRQLLAQTGIDEHAGYALPDEETLRRLAAEAMQDDGVNVTARPVTEQDCMEMYRKIFRPSAC